jgi:hypothetical protein
MHAYASDDPVFRAMNQRGQRLTNGQLGSFCVQCHAPMAVNEGATTDGMNLDSVDPKLHGVTCFFCHTVQAVTGTHNNALQLANPDAGDIVMRGEYPDPLPNTGHPATKSPLMDRFQLQSATTCGACHDIVVSHAGLTDPKAIDCLDAGPWDGGGSPCGAAIERTFQEWEASAFKQEAGETCSNCHMNVNPNGPDKIAAYPGAQPRSESTTDPGLPPGLGGSHDHSFPGIDVALIPGFPSTGEQQQGIQYLLDSTIQSAICVITQGLQPNSAIRVILDNVAAGHDVPSGSAQDRRMWAEVVAYDRDGGVIYSSGVISDGGSVVPELGDGGSPDGGADPDLWLIRDCMLDSQNQETHNFWEAANYETNQIPVQPTFSQLDPRFYLTHVIQYFPRNPFATVSGTPARVTLRLRVQPIGYDVLDDLIATGDLDPSLRSAMPILDVQWPTPDGGLGPFLEWTPGGGAVPLVGDPLGAGVGGGSGLNLPAECVTTTHLKYAATNNPAVNHTICKP